MQSSLEIQLQTLPDNPGVYQYYDKDGKLLYVGKAKNLKKRVASYFTKMHENGKTRVLVKKIATVKHIVVATESDALLLENNLIKKYQPKYNVMLKDDKTYPWLCIKNESFPRVFATRNKVNDGSEYFGPYTSFKTVHTILDLIKELYQLRTCNYELTPSNIKAEKFKVCLEYHLKNCKGPCEGYESEGEYLEKIKGVREILKGNFKDSLHRFKKMMSTYAQNLEFEEANELKKKSKFSKTTNQNPPS